MVRLMRWMIGLILTAVSASFRSHYVNLNTQKSKLFSTIEDVGGVGNVDRPKEQLMYDEPVVDWKNHLYPIAHDLQYKDSSHLRHLLQVSDSNNNETCIPPSVEDFPENFFTDEQTRKGGIVVHIILATYACYALAAICDTYFVPSLQLLSNKLGLSSDVAGATFMAAGTSSPELFESIVGSFITEGDIGVGTIVGSAVFNILAVTSVCGLLSGKMVPLDWWPLTRDCVYYAFTVIALVIVMFDEKIYWYEAMVLLIMFFIYVVFMRFNRMASVYFHSLPCCNRAEHMPVMSLSESDDKIRVENGIKQTAVEIVSDISESSRDGGGGNGVCDRPEDAENPCNDLLDENQAKVIEHDEDNFSPCKIPDGWFGRIAYIITYPINLLFFFTVPDCTRKGWERLFPLTFLMSVLYIGSLSYFVAWMVTIMGYTIGIPDTVMGITFLAIGTSVPEGYSSVIVCRQGMGNMAISNSVGSNIFDILFCLGLPWLIKAVISDDGYVTIHSVGLVYLSMALLATVGLMYLVVALFKFSLNRKQGATCLVLYALFLTLACLMEMNVFGEFSPPTCKDS
ncbi:hypothetical protein CHUAL_013421 [Chamberlinius hualienensis]